MVTTSIEQKKKVTDWQSDWNGPVLGDNGASLANTSLSCCSPEFLINLMREGNRGREKDRDVWDATFYTGFLINYCSWWWCCCSLLFLLLLLLPFTDGWYIFPCCNRASVECLFMRCNSDCFIRHKTFCFEFEFEGDFHLFYTWRSLSLSPPFWTFSSIDSHHYWCTQFNVIYWYLF